MKTVSKLSPILVTGVVLLSPGLQARQNAGDAPDAHVAAAKAAAGDRYQNLFNFLCAVPNQGVRPGGAGARGRRGGGPPPGPPERSTWYVEPAKVFDNLYFVGQSEYAAWALTTSDGIILFDTLFDYSVEDAVVGGLRKLGLDPATIRYVVVSHPHPDHHGGAKLLQDRYKARILMSAADWDVLDRLNGTRPARDMVVTDGQRLTLGDTTVTLHVTPGHTPGTISSVFQVRDGGTTHTVAYWGGTGLNPDRESIQAYVQSAQRFTDIARQVKADVLMSNHTDWDGAKAYLPRLATRAPGSPHPYVVGPDGVRSYMDVARECATARLLRLN